MILSNVMALSNLYMPTISQIIFYLYSGFIYPNLYLTCLVGADGTLDLTGKIRVLFTVHLPKSTLSIVVLISVKGNLVFLVV